MRKIVIHKKKSPDIILYDDDNSDFNQYSSNLSSILDSKEICILETSTSVTILKPSEISGITVYPSDNKIYTNKLKDNDIIYQKEEDIITDGE